MGRPPSPEKRMVHLHCGHRRVFPFPFPEKGDVLWCPDCCKETIAVIPTVYSIRCQKKSCRFGRNNRASKYDAIQTAKKHVEARPSHELRIYADGRPIHWVRQYEDGEWSDTSALRDASKLAQTFLPKPLDTGV